MAKPITKARYWWGVLYPENMIEDWEDKIGDLLQVPYAYIKHTADLDSKSEHRKDHVHLIVVFSNTTTYKHALSIFSLLNAPGKKAVNHVEACVNIRHCYDYLIHDTETCRKKGKHLYDSSARIIGNTFDIGAYEQISAAEKKDMLRELCDFVLQKKITNMADFYILASQNYEPAYFDVIIAYNSIIDRLTRGNYLKYSEESKAKDKV